ncbi:unnamed protein product [Cochlearia groenlandica]
MIKMDIQRLFLKKEAQQTFGQTSRRCQSQVTVTRSVLEERNSTFFRLKTSRRCQSQVTCYIRPNIYLDVKPKLKELLKKKTQQRRKEETQSGYEHLKNAKGRQGRSILKEETLEERDSNQNDLLKKETHPSLIRSSSKIERPKTRGKPQRRNQEKDKGNQKFRPKSIHHTLKLVKNKAVMMNQRREGPRRFRLQPRENATTSQNKRLHKETQSSRDQRSLLGMLKKPLKTKTKMALCQRHGRKKSTLPGKSKEEFKIKRRRRRRSRRSRVWSRRHPNETSKVVPKTDLSSCKIRATKFPGRAKSVLRSFRAVQNSGCEILCELYAKGVTWRVKEEPSQDL